MRWGTLYWVAGGCQIQNHTGFLPPVKFISRLNSEPACVSLCQRCWAAIRRGITALDCVKMNMSDYIRVGVISTKSNLRLRNSGR